MTWVSILNQKYTPAPFVVVPGCVDDQLWPLVLYPKILAVVQSDFYALHAK